MSTPAKRQQVAEIERQEMERRQAPVRGRAPLTSETSIVAATRSDDASKGDERSLEQPAIPGDAAPTPPAELTSPNGLGQPGVRDVDALSGAGLALPAGLLLSDLTLPAGSPLDDSVVGLRRSAHRAAAFA